MNNQYATSRHLLSSSQITNIVKMPNLLFIVSKSHEKYDFRPINNNET